MSKVCEICGKAPVAGRSISHSHRVSNRTFRPNIQKITVKVDGKVKRANVCTKCMKAGKVERAQRFPSPLPRAFASQLCSHPKGWLFLVIAIPRFVILYRANLSKLEVKKKYPLPLPGQRCLIRKKRRATIGCPSLLNADCEASNTLRNEQHQSNEARLLKLEKALDFIHGA